MSKDVLTKPFLKHPLFVGLKNEQIREIIRNAERIVFSSGDTIISEDGPYDAALLIVSGDAVRTSGPEILNQAEAVPAGSLVGEMAMLIDTHHTSTIVARGPVCALKISRAHLHEQMATDPTLADHFVEKISQRLGEMAMTLRKMDEFFAAHGADAHLH